jgi:hypothetical protein
VSPTTPWPYKRHEDAIRLIGAAQSLRERIGGGAPINFLAGFMGDPETEARAHLSQKAAQRAINEGRTMSVDAALALAERTPPPKRRGIRHRRPSLTSWAGRPWTARGQPGSTDSS